ncbi:Peptidase T2 asparaginase 2 [Trinorchestia longiramus]|nr:Peptidase T2 asparaginase 2 [Trinorchestia longiramus]
MAGYIAVHVGAGDHSLSKHPVYKYWMKEACRKGQLILKNGGSAVDAVAAAIEELETCDITNAGYGSALTNKGTVECDAGIMDGGSLRHAGVGAVSGIKHPISVAHKLLVLQSKPLVGNLVPPALLVGEGAVEWAASNGLQVCDESKLVSAKSLERHRYYLRQLRKLKHKQKREKLAANEGSKDGSKNSTCNCMSRDVAISNQSCNGDVCPPNTDNNFSSSMNTCPTNCANPVSHARGCDLSKTACYDESHVPNTTMSTDDTTHNKPSDPPGKNFCINDPAKKDSASVEDPSLKSLSCDSNMETSDDREPVEGVCVHQGDSPNPCFGKQLKCRSSVVRCDRKSDQSSRKLRTSCERNLRSRSNAGNCKLEECVSEPRSCGDGEVLSKLVLNESKEQIKQETISIAQPSTAELRCTKVTDKNAIKNEGRSFDKCDSSSYCNRRHKRVKTDHDAASPALHLPKRHSPNVRKSLQSVLDTVGCVAVGADGTVAAGASSGGILLKTPGRVGQSAILGAGYWAENRCKESRHNIAVCTSGCGEMLVSSHLAMNVAADVAGLAEANWDDLPARLTALMLDSKFLQSYSRPKSSGCLILKHDPTEGSTDLYCCHTAISFGYAYMGVEDKKPTAVFSTMNREQEGQEVIMDCFSYFPRTSTQPKLGGTSDGLQASTIMPTWKILDPESTKNAFSVGEDSGLVHS